MCGIAILFRKTFKCEILKTQGSSKNAEIEILSQRFVITNICTKYQYNFQQLSVPDRIIMGDFNLTLEPDIDRLGTYHNNDRSKVILQEMMNELMMIDAWWILNP